VRAITLHAPYATLLVTRQPGTDLRCERCGASASLPLGMTCPDHQPRIVPQPMVKQWHTSDEPCPPELLNQRVAIYQDGIIPMYAAIAVGPAPRCHKRWPLGAIVGSGIITESLPITECSDHTAHVCHSGGGLLMHYPLRGDLMESEWGITDQIPYGDWTPGRWAWRITEATPTTERCPWCWGRGWTDTADGVHSAPCPCCQRAGFCDPIPATGKQGWWTWTP
jgi:hypothetical protein